jgi:DNA polymerase-3 subunit epsilon
MSVLRKTLELYQIPFPNLFYACSYIFSKKIWTGLPSYDLKTLCKINNIHFTHHRAGEDSKATAELCLKAFEIAYVFYIEDLPEKLQTTIGQLYVGGYKPSETKRIYNHKDISTIIYDTAKHNPASIFYGKKVIFIGTLSSMTRIEYQQLIADIGGINANGVTKDTDFLIVGHQDYRIVSCDGMISKQKYAIKLIEKESNLEIISEEDFLKNI